MNRVGTVFFSHCVHLPASLLRQLCGWERGEGDTLRRRELGVDAALSIAGCL